MKETPHSWHTMIMAMFCLPAAFLSGQQEEPAAASTPAATPTPEEPATPGLALVRGQVTDAIGSGLAGVQVELKRKETTNTPGELVAQTQSDDMGDFILRGSTRLSGTFMISLYKDQFAPLARELVLTLEGPLPFVGETLQGNLAVSGRVFDARNGQPVAQAAVEISASFHDWNIQTDTAGQFTLKGLPPGGVDVTVDATGFARQKQSLKSLADSPQLEFALRPQRIMRLRIVDESANPIVGVEVELLDPLQDDTRAAVSDENGMAFFSGLAAETETVKARLSHPGFLSSESFDRSIPLDPETAESEHSVTLLRAASVSGVIYDSDGRPLQGARIMAGKDFAQRLARSWTNEDGKFDLTGLAEGAIVLTVHRADFGPDLKVVETKRGETVTTELSLNAGRIVKGTMKDENGRPVPEREVISTTWRGFTTLGLRAMTDHAGRFELRDAPKDEFSIVTHVPGTSPISRLIASHETEIELIVPANPSQRMDPKAEPPKGGAE